MTERRSASRAILLAVAVATTLVVLAPFIGEARRWLRATLPGQYVLIINLIVGSCALAVVVTALVRVRSQRVLRFGLMAAGALGAVTYATLTGSTDAGVAAVEHFHFVQYGLIVWLFYRAWRPQGDLTSLCWPLAAALVFGAAEEWLQWFVPGRVGEINDVLLNGVAIVCGLLVSTGLQLPASGWWRPSAAAVRRAGAGLVVVVAVLAAFIWTIHVGYAIDDPAGGRFLSRYSASQLDQLAADRAARWATDPPLVLARVSREDQYRSEAEAHVRARNNAWDAGDVRTAWHENLILERYYAPVLDTPSHVSATGHRWAPEHRLDAERRYNALPPGTFTSRAAVDTRWTFGPAS